MNPFRFTLPLIVVSTFAIASCKKDDPQPGEPEPTGTTPPVVSVKKPLYAVVDGNFFDAAMPNGQLSSGSVMIDGHDGSKILVLNIPVDAPVGSTHSIGSSADYTLHYSPNNYVTIFTAVSGSLTVTKNDTGAKKMEGTFEGTVLSADSTTTMTITGGQFNCSYF